MKDTLSFTGRLLSAGLVLGMAGQAHAHINMLAPLQSRNKSGNPFEDPQKISPCDGNKGDSPVYTFEPGAIITLGVREGIPHDSYFRIAFDDDGQDGFKNPASIDPINEKRVEESGVSGAVKRPGFDKCLQDPADQCGKSDFCNVVSKTGGATVLWDNIDPHKNIGAKEWSWTIQLPDVECENCTIQLIQVMEDIAGGFHGPFDNKNDLYYRCIDIKLKRGAGKTGPGNAAGPVKVNGIDCTKAEMTDAGVELPDSGVVTYLDAGEEPSPGDGGSLADAGVPGNGFDSGAQPGVDAGSAGGGTAGGAPPAAGDSDDGCSVSFGAGRSAGGLTLALLAIGALIARRARKRD